MDSFGPMPRESMIRSPSFPARAVTAFRSAMHDERSASECSPIGSAQKGHTSCPFSMSHRASRFSACDGLSPLSVAAGPPDSPCSRSSPVESDVTVPHASRRRTSASQVSFGRQGGPSVSIACSSPRSKCNAMARSTRATTTRETASGFGTPGHLANILDHFPRGNTDAVDNETAAADAIDQGTVPRAVRPPAATDWALKSLPLVSGRGARHTHVYGCSTVG